MKKSVLIICDSDLSKEPRVIRQIVALKDDYKVFTLGAKASGFDGVEHFNYTDERSNPKHWSYPLPIRKAYSGYLYFYERFRDLYINSYYNKNYWNSRRTEALQQLAGKKFDVVIAHHWDALPIAYEIAKPHQSKIVFNVHDYYTRQFEYKKEWVEYQQNFVQYIMSKYVPKCDLMFSAWTKIQDDYSKQFGVSSIIINNATEYNDLQPVLKTSDDEKIKIIHHGISNSNRLIEKMIQMMDHLDDRFQLDMMLVSSPHEQGYFNSLKELASKNKNIRFVDPVPTREISKSINQYDIGLFLLPLNGFNPTYTLPNKLFEFVQGRLASLVTPNIEMKRVVEQYDLGWVTEDFEPKTAAEKIKNITKEELNQKKANAHKWAYELSAEKNYTRIIEAIENLNKQKINRAEAVLA